MFLVRVSASSFFQCFENHTTELHQLSVHITYGPGSVRLWRHCDTLCTSGFVDDVMFVCHGASGPESSTTLCLERVRQMAVPVGRQTAAVFGEVFYLRLSCFWLPV